jgi:ribonuclease BN (tRNA processing enzyme)
MKKYWGNGSLVARILNIGLTSMHASHIVDKTSSNKLRNKNKKSIVYSPPYVSQTVGGHTLIDSGIE